MSEGDFNMLGESLDALNTTFNSKDSKSPPRYPSPDCRESLPPTASTPHQNSLNHTIINNNDSMSSYVSVNPEIQALQSRLQSLVRGSPFVQKPKFATAEKLLEGHDSENNIKFTSFDGTDLEFSEDIPIETPSLVFAKKSPPILEPIKAVHEPLFFSHLPSSSDQSTPNTRPGIQRKGRQVAGPKSRKMQAKSKKELGEELQDFSEDFPNQTTSPVFAKQSSTSFKTIQAVHTPSVFRHTPSSSDQNTPNLRPVISEDISNQTPSPVFAKKSPPISDPTQAVHEPSLFNHIPSSSDQSTPDFRPVIQRKGKKLAEPKSCKRQAKSKKQLKEQLLITKNDSEQLSYMSSKNINNLQEMTEQPQQSRDSPLDICDSVDKKRKSPVTKLFDLLDAFSTTKNNDLEQRSDNSQQEDDQAWNPSQFSSMGKRPQDNSDENDLVVVMDDGQILCQIDPEDR